MMPDPVITQPRIQIEHVRIEAAKPFEAVKAALEDLVPPLDPAIPEALREGDIRRAKGSAAARSGACDLQRQRSWRIAAHCRPRAQGRAVRDRQSAHCH
jgi:hypothetical protein